MAVMPIVAYPDDRLRKKAVDIDESLPNLDQIIDDMIDTMYDARGIGLAANQVGLPWNLAIIDEFAFEDPENPRSSHLEVYINPELLSQEGKVDSEEGCLSIAGFRDSITRSEKVTVRYLNRQFEEQTMEAEGLLAIALQHEIDHLNGKLFVDHLSSLKRNLLLKKYKQSLNEVGQEASYSS